MAVLRQLKPLRPLKPLPAQRVESPQEANARKLRQLATQPQPRVVPQPVPHSLYAAYTARLEAVAARAYQVADVTVIAAVKRQQVLAEQYRARDDADDPDPETMTPAERAAYQNQPHTPAQKRQLLLPFPVAQAVERMNERIAAMTARLPLLDIIIPQAGRIERFAAGVNVTVLTQLGLTPIKPESAIAAMRDVWVAENAGLIKSIPQEIAQRVGAKVDEMVRAGSRWETIAEHLQQEEGIGKRRSELIARDQTNKYNGALNEAYQREAGIEHYEWRGAMDARERPTHVALQGMVFSWDDPPPVGHPGEDFRCRCIAAPVVSAAKIAKSTTITAKELNAKAASLGPRVKDL